MVSVKNNPATRNSSSARRTQIVWAAFLVATTIVTGVLALQETRPSPGFLLTNVEVIGDSTNDNTVFRTSEPLDHNRWTGIVIHHLGEPAGDAESVHRKHLNLGYQGLGYHFLIGNGIGLGDGVIHVGYRWDTQLPGAHVLGNDEVAANHNQRSIGICLIGNGNRRTFTERQKTQLVRLVRSLQEELGIPGSKVFLHRDVVSQTTSPGKYFASAAFRQQLLSSPPRSIHARGR